MKINHLDAHDRFLSFQKNQTEVAKFIEKMIDKRPWGSRHFYIFIIHRKSLGVDERQSLVEQQFYHNLEDTPAAFMVMSCRITKPEAAPNTTLIRVHPDKTNEAVHVLWSIPQVELWEQFEKGKMFENPYLCTFIEAFKKDPVALSRFDEWDPATQEEFNDLMKNRKEGLLQRIPIYEAMESKALYTTPDW